MTVHARFLSGIILFVISCLVLAADDARDEKEKSKEKALEVVKVIDDVYAIVGPLGNRTPENLGNNATFGFIVTADGVVLIDPGGTYLGAQKIHALIKSITSQPVKYVINTGGQDHRWLGNDYFKKLGAKVIASKDAVKDQKARARDIFFGLSNTAGDKALQGTHEAFADIVFDNFYKLQLANSTIEIHHPSAAHSPGDSFVWLPQQSVIFSGDIIYLDRLLSVMSFSSSKAWVAAFENLAAFNPKYVVPGHGHPSTLEKAKYQTYGYLTLLREKVGMFMDEGGIIQDVSKIDQSEYSFLENFDLLKGRNVQQVYQEMEWE